MPMTKGPHAPYKLTPEIRQKLEAVAAKDGTLEEMAYYANVSKQTIVNWLARDPELKKEIDRLRAKPMLKARDTIVNSLSDPAHAQWYVERKAKKEFNTRPDPEDMPGATPPVVNVIIKQCPGADAPDVEVQQ